MASIVIGVCYASGPFTGAFLNKYGIRISTIIGCLLSSSALAMGSFVDYKNIFLLYVTFSLPFAVGASFIYVSSTVIASLYFEKRRSVALGLITGGQGLGTMILGPALQALQVSVDWRNTFRLFAIALFVLSFTGLLLRQGSRPTCENKDSRKLRFNFKLLKKPSVLIRIILPLFFSFSRMVPYVHLVSIMCNSPCQILKSKSSEQMIGSPRFDPKVLRKLTLDVRQGKGTRPCNPSIFSGATRFHGPTTTAFVNELEV